MDEGEKADAGRARDFEMPNNLMSQAHSPKGKSGGSNEEGDYCRICRSEATDEMPLFYPCKCSGSIKFVHQNCLMEWLSHSQKKYCELCKTPFRFTKLYDHRMPQTLPFPVFIRHLCLHVVRNTLKWFRYLVVGLVWLGWLPWSIRQVWRGLFWVADGTWGSTTNMNAGASSPHLHDFRNTTTGEDSAVEVSLSVTQNIVSALPQIATPLSTFLDYSSSDFLLVKIVQALYPDLFHWSAALVTAASSNSTDLSSGPDRQPSFLSDVRYLKTLTNYQTINNSVTDVLEGQLICLLIVTAFILIFLIREWVINQHPPADIPEANRAEEARPVVAHGALRGPARRRRRWPGEDGREEVVRQVAGQRPRPRFPVRNVEAEDGGIGTSDVPGIRRPPAYVSEGSGAASTADNDLAGHPQAEDASSPRNRSFVTRPALPNHNALQNAPSIRRAIEEGGASPKWPGLDTFKDLWYRAGSDPAEVLRIINEEDRQDELGWVVAQMERLRQQNLQLSQSGLHTRPAKAKDAVETEVKHENGEQIGDIADHIQSLDLSPWLEPSDELDLSEAEESILAVQSAGHDSLESLFHRDPTETLTETFSDPATAPTLPASTDASPREVTVQEPESMNPVHDGDVSRTAVVAGNPDMTVDGETNEPAHPHTAIETLADWLWQTDEYLAQADGRLGEDDERLVQNVNQEAPFVPVPAAEVISDNEEVESEIEAEGEQNPEAHAAAGAAGIDVNNPEAIEDAEDLDGIMELIGMQGPLTGMVQNVIFTEFLITFTLAASVWLPYIWGKIALLLLANPLGVFVRAPFHLLSKVADTSVDILLFVLGMCVYLLHFCLSLLLYLASFVHPNFRPWVDTHSIGRMSLTLASGSGTRLEKVIFRTVWGLKPDLPTFSVLSHQALRLFERQAIKNLETTGQLLLYVCYEVPVQLRQGFKGGLRIPKSTISEVIPLLVTPYRQTVNTMVTLYQRLRGPQSLSPGVDAPLDTSSLDYSLVRWNTQDRIIAIVIGYAFFAFAGYLYIKVSRLILGLKKGDRMEGVVADGLHQAGGVMKVIVIIGIEMIIFPLYCGLLLDVALMPLFEGVGFQSRLTFVMNAPMTALFVHWFAGTCYMFHFALFVSMCRKIMRRGVLYFIRDPDDPTFHPVRDVLERPIATQLSKVAFSGLVYGGLVILCLGGIVWVVSRVEGIFPIHWTSDEPILEFPIDLLFYNFLLPILIRNIEPSKKLNTMYEWWFRKCARWLRLSNFLFNEQEDDEQGRHVRSTWSAVFRRKGGTMDKPVMGEDRRIPTEDRGLETYFIRDGTFVRTPGSDSVRIPKGGRVFLEVDENNNRIDGQADEDDGPHGRKNGNFVKVYIPPMFRTRIAAFVIYVWAFAAVTGIVFAIVPLSIGRKCIHLITQNGRPPNDLYAFSVGLYLCGSMVYLFSYFRVCRDWALEKVEYYFRDTTLALPRLRSSAVYISGLAYMGLMFGFILPFLFSSLVELYFVIPLHTYVTSTYTAKLSAVSPAVLPPTIHVVQTWTLGLVYLRVILRLATTYPDPQTRAATAIRSILRRGFWRPDVRLATRSFVLPSIVLFSILLAAPLCLGWMINASLRDPRLQAKVYRYAYPGILGVALALYSAVFLRRQVGVWRTRIRDDVYLIGERLHNFGEAQRRQNKGKAKAWVRDGAVPDRLQIR